MEGELMKSQVSSFETGEIIGARFENDAAESSGAADGDKAKARALR